MTNLEQLKTVQLAGTRRTCPCHACGFFSNKEEEYRVMLPFMAEDVAVGDKLFNIIDRRDRDERLARMKTAGIDVEAAERSGQLELRPSEQAHLAGGRFDMSRMLELLDRTAASDKGDYRLVRCWSNREWALQDNVTVDDILEYEGRFNHVAKLR